ncbi:MAG: BON domain-containing protein [Betaproteobacteria bacterium]|nr:BON domain-containing protein [Betaproteobacteria bacterium]
MKPKQPLFRIAIAALASTAPAASGVAHAADDSRQPSRLFLQLDVNHDGYVSRSEAANARGFDQAFAEVKAALIKDLDLKAFDVGVETNQGRVLLSGFVDDRHQARHAVRLASAVRGVERVENALKLK